jgi:hypothetical protein
MQSVSWETSVNLKPSVAAAFTNTEMVSIGSTLSPAWLNSKALTVYDCPDMKTIMPNMRDGVISSKDWEILNSRIETTINLETLVIRNQRTTLDYFAKLLFLWQVAQITAGTKFLLYGVRSLP